MSDRFRKLLVVLLLVGISPTPLCLTAAEPVQCTVEADSTLAAPRFAPFRLLDGETADTESRWASARSAEPHWVTLTFPESVAIDRLVVYAHRQPDLVLRAAEVQIDSGDGWRRVAGVEANQQTPVRFDFPPCRAKAVRLWITDACRQDSTARLFEIELFSGSKPVDLEASRIVSTQPRIDDQTLLDSVRPLPDSLFVVPDESTRNGRLLIGYRDAVRRWGAVLADRIEPVPDREGEAYYGRVGNREDDIRPIGYAAMVNGLLWRMETTTSGRAQEYRDDAASALRYLTASHVTGPSTCLNGEPWGDAWQSAMWTRAAGLGAWALWDELDQDLKLATARMIEFEADRFITLSPKSSTSRDTGAEENAWNALILSLASNMMPGHPRAGDWDLAAKRYMYNVFSVPADADDTSPGDDGRPVNAWVTTVNTHADFTVENHGLVHIGYQKTSLAQLLENAAHYLAIGNPPPAACRHHVADAAELVYRCADWDGSPVYFGGNDWKIVHTQPADLPIYAVLSVAGDRRATLLEERGLQRVARLQDAEGGFFNVRRDLEYGGLCATRLAICYLVHAARGAGAEPISPSQFDRQMAGVWHLEGGRAMLHRTPGKFASFAYGPKWLALTLPSGPDRAVWPHFASYLGLIDGETPTERQAEAIQLSPPPFADGFWAVGRLNRCGGKVEHDFAFISPAEDVTVYVQRLRFRDGFQPKTCETGIIGHEFDIGSNARTFHGRFGTLDIQGTGGPEEMHELATHWLNVADRIGYVVKRFPEAPNVVRYHDLAGGSGRVPKLQEWFSLVGNPSESPQPAAEQWACVITYPNRSPGETEQLSKGVQWSVNQNASTATVSFGEKSNTIRVDFDGGTVRMP